MKMGRLSSKKKGVIEVSIPIEKLLKSDAMTILLYTDDSYNGSKGPDDRSGAFINYRQVKEMPCVRGKTEKQFTEKEPKDIQEQNDDMTVINALLM